MDWDNPEERAALIEKIGIEAYNKAFEEHIKGSTIVTVGDHNIRPIRTRFGLLYQCGNSGKAFKTLSAAEDYARNN